MELQVVKRDGSVEPLSLKKIHAVTEWACQSLDVSQSELEIEARLMFFDGIKTSDIHDALIKSAATLISVGKQDYTNVAARLLLQKLYKEVTGGGVEYPTLLSYIEKGICENRLNPELFAKFSMSELDMHIAPSRDLLFNYVGLQTLTDRYLIRETQKVGKVALIIELPQHFWMRVAMGLALNEANPTAAAIEFYEVLSTLQFVSSTPTLFNSGTLHSQLSSCYLNTVSDEIGELGGTTGIFNAIVEVANLSKYAGGIGTDWTRVRPAGDPIVSTNGKSSGVVPYLKIFNDTAVAVNQSFVPGTLIVTDKGMTPVEDIDETFMLMNIEGEFKSVEKLKAYDQHDPVVAVQTKRGIEPLMVTAGHPIAVVRGIKEREAYSRIDWKSKPIEWVEAKDLLPTDMMVYVIPSCNLNPTGVSADDARMYGIMLGDGHVKRGRNEAGVSLGTAKKQETIDFVEHYLTKKGVGFSVRFDGACKYINWTASNLSNVSRESLYSEKGEKRISGEMLHLPENMAFAMLCGMLETDGYKKNGTTMVYVTTSKQLAEGVRFIASKFGVLATGHRKETESVEFTKRNGDKVVCDNCSDVYEVSIPTFHELGKRFDIKTHQIHQGWFKFGDYLLDKVESVKDTDYKGMVYDFEMAGQPSYQVANGLVHNGGKRNGAFAAYLEPWHPDLYEFCDLKKNSGDERRRAHDIFPALWMPDLFFTRVKAQGIWSFFSPAEHPDLHELYGDAFEARYSELEAQGKARKQLPAMEVWKKILTSLFETGHPWITYKDECNRRNPQDHVGVIHSSNLCTEITLNTSDDETAVCNLGSINLARVDGSVNLRRVVRTAMRMLDNVIDINFYPSGKAKLSNLRHRPVGLGVMGYMEWLVKNGVDFESVAHLEIADSLFEHLSYYAIEASSDLAVDRGRYPSYKGSKWSRGILPIDTARFPNTTKNPLNWVALRAKVLEQGMRNSNLMAIAPTATISLVAGTTQCIEPVFAREYTKTNLSGTFTVIDPTLKYGRPELCKEAFEVDPRWIIRSAAIRQRWIDQSQSVNIFVRGDVTGPDLSELYIKANELGLKTTYYLRTQAAELKKMEPIGIDREAFIPIPDVPTSIDLSGTAGKFCTIEDMQSGCESCQ